MALSADLVSQFARVVNGDKKPQTESTVYGTIVESDGKKYVRLDGSNLDTPISTTTDAKHGDRVTVLIKDHSAVVTGNISSPSINTETELDNGDGTSTKISEFGIIVAKKVDVDTLDAEIARVGELIVGDLVAEELEAYDAKIDKLETDNVTINEKLEAHDAFIDNLDATFVKADVLEANYATIKDLEATDVKVRDLEADFGELEKATIEDLAAFEASIKNLDATYANIDFSNIKMAAVEELFTKSGIIKDLVVGDQSITGELVGVTIKGDLIEAGTVKAEKLVVKGSDGIFYKLNVEAGGLSAEEAPTESLHGSVIAANSITAEKVNVKDLVAFDATIGGFHITDNSIYSGAKASVDNDTATGIYQDSEGQFALGDGNQFLKFYKQSDGTYKLDISAASISLGSKSVETVIDDAVDSLVYENRNLILDSNREISNNEYWMGAYVPSSPLVANKVYTATICVTPAIDGQCISLATSGGYTGLCELWTSGTNKQIISRTFTCSYYEGRTPEDNLDYANVDIYRYPNDGTVTSNTTIHWIKIEEGTKATDWTPAPEDLELRVAGTEQRVNENAADISNAESRIDQLANSIVTIVKDSNGQSMLQQTSTGWTFSTEQLEKDVNQTQKDLSALTSDVTNVNDIVTGLSNRLQAYDDYVHVGSRDGEPCIELGERSNDNKVIITNTRILFQEGSAVPVYIKDRTLVAENVTVTQRLSNLYKYIGNWSWGFRPNGNYGLTFNYATEGRNLILNSNTEVNSTAYAIATCTPSYILTEGTTYTMSICITPGRDGLILRPHVSSGMSGLFDVSCAGTYKQIVRATFTMRYYANYHPSQNASYGNIVIYRYPDDGALTTIHWVKIEEGTNATEWSPAPEDLF